MRRRIISLSIAGVLATMGEFIAPSMASSKEIKKKKPVYGNGKTKRTKGKRERSLKSRANRMKAKRSK